MISGVDERDRPRRVVPEEALSTTDVRMRRVAMITSFAAIAPLTVVAVVLTATSWWDAVITAVGYVLGIGVLRVWSLDGYSRRAFLALAFTTAAWVVGTLTASGPIAFVPLAVVGALLLARTSPRWPWVVSLVTGVGLVGGASLLRDPAGWQRAAEYVLLPVVGTLFVVGVILLSEQAWTVVRRLERARETEADLAVARERVRIAADLHDIQGHSLHVIKLKAALAGRQVRTDPDAARAELAEIRRLVDEALAQTRVLASARHELNLVAEVENARRLGEAAGIAVSARVEPGAAAAAHPLLAQVLREATTNLLRHAHPSAVTIAASPGEVEVANDGVLDGAGAPWSGLARLRERVEEAGGTLSADRRADRFVLTARIGTAAPDRVEERSP